MNKPEAFARSKQERQPVDSSSLAFCNTNSRIPVKSLFALRVLKSYLAYYVLDFAERGDELVEIRPKKLVSKSRMVF